MTGIEILGSLLWGGAIGFAFGRWPVHTTVLMAAAVGLSLFALSPEEASTSWEWTRMLVIGVGYITGKLIEWRTRDGK